MLVDFHAEATSEKVAMGRLLAGRVTAVLGTHTHVQTNDAQVLAGGTAYITDAGMTGPHDSVIGVRTDLILRRFTTADAASGSSPPTAASASRARSSSAARTAAPRRSSRSGSTSRR